MAAITFFINAAFLITPLAVILGTHHPPPAKNLNEVQIQVGKKIGDANAADNAGGSVPHLAIWDADGNRVGQYKGKANGHIKEGDTATYQVYNTQNGDTPAQPEYLSVVMNEGDAICISMIMVTGNNAQWTWTGDMAYSCDSDWYYSNATLGNSNYQSKCAWIDKDKTNGIIPQGLSLHMRDFSSDQGLANEYQQNIDTLCKVSQRMTFWPEIVPDADLTAPGYIFSPPLTYIQTQDETLGADIDGKKLINRKTKLYPDGALKRSEKYRKDARVLQKRNLAPEHLVISHSENHSAKMLCEHPTSLGMDFVSVQESIYCDMESREWWYLCSPALLEGCFDFDKKKMRGNAPGHHGLDARDRMTGRDIPAKDYTTVEMW